MQIKLPETQGSNFWEAHSLALEHGAIDMSVGMTEFNCPQRLSELALSYIQNGYNNFSSPEGILPLRERISESFHKNYGKLYHPGKEITICAGPVQAATTVINTVVNEGDEVLLTDPSGFTYSQAVRLNGGMPVYVPLKEPGFRIDWEDMRKMINSKTRLIILSSPHNPTGRVLSHDDLMQLQKLTNGTGIYILSDEFFEHLVYDQEKHLSPASFENLAARTFIISSYGAVFHINGWSIAWCLAPENLMKEFRKVHENSSLSVATPLQHALADYLDEATDIDQTGEFYQGKRNYFNRLLKDSPFILEPCAGTYFQLINYRNISRETDIQFAKRLILEAGVAATPLSLFMHKRRNMYYLRFCFAKKNETLEEAARRLTAFASGVSG